MSPGSCAINKGGVLILLILLNMCQFYNICITYSLLVNVSKELGAQFMWGRTHVLKIASVIDTVTFRIDLIHMVEIDFIKRVV